MKAKTWFIENKWIIIILIIAAALRFYRLDFQSLWLDEIHTINDSNPQLSISEVYSSILQADPHPPLYFYIIQILFKIFGYTALVARSFSAVFGVVSVVALYKLGKELMNKQVGLIAAFLLSINPFHIYHSQDARPYSLLCFATIVSFLYLVKFIKKPEFLNAIYYGASAALMLYGHFFSLFALFSQFLILAIFFALTENKLRLSYFLNSAIAFGVILILFVPPSLNIFLAAMEIKNFWIPLPTNEVYTDMLKEFFGNSEIVMYLFFLASVCYFYNLSRIKGTVLTNATIVGNKHLLGFIVLSVWIVTVLIFPLIRSYTSIPMIVSRYFINILPAVILVISIGIFQFKNNVIKIIFLSTVFIFSTTDLIVVKSYYTSVSKTQFREVSQFINENNINDDTIETSLSWYFPYFLTHGANKSTIEQNNLDEYIAKIAKDSANLGSFWYVDAHIRPYKVNDQTQEFLDKNFFIDNEIELFDAWTKHYSVLGSAPQTIDISKFRGEKGQDANEIGFSQDLYSDDDNILKFSGWANFQGIESKHTKITVVLIKNDIAYVVPTIRNLRPDVTAFFKSTLNLDNSGFKVDYNLKNFDSGKYQVAVYLKNDEENKTALKVTDIFIEIPKSAILNTTYSE